MPRYVFNIISNGERRQSAIATFPDNDAAQREAAGMFVDVARDYSSELRTHPAWQIEVVDEADKIIFRLSVLAEF